MISKDVAKLSQQWQCIMLHIHQYGVQILYKPGLKLFIVVWLSCHSHMENQDQDIPSIDVSIHTTSTSVDIPICTSIKDIQAATGEDVYLQVPKWFIIGGWPDLMEAVEPGAEKYWPIGMSPPSPVVL